MRPIAVLDACVLIPMPVADTLLRLAEPPALYDPRWTEEILAEVTRTLVVRFGKTRERALYREAAMREFFPDSMVANYEPLVAQMTNHPKDRHVLAAAVASRADYLVTFNLKDFVSEPALSHGVVVTGPSSFLKQLVALDRDSVEERLHQQATAIGISRSDLLDRLAGPVPGFVSMLREP
jgi:predicted nucleic acid-binding protein